MNNELKFQVTDFQPPIVKINYETLKEQLQVALKDYTGLVVTEETLPACKAAQRELAGVRRKIDTFRKEKKEELSGPIKAMEAQCKDLIADIEKAEKPIKEGIKLFDDKRKQEKADRALEIIKETIENVGLNEKYAAQLTVIDDYRRLSQKEADTRKDIESRAFALMMEQKKDDEIQKLIEHSIEMENERLSNKMKFEDFKGLLDRGYSATEIIDEIKKKAEWTYKTEHPEPKEEPVEVVKEPEIKKNEIPQMDEKQAEAKKEQLADNPLYQVELRITGTAEEIRLLAEFLKDNSIMYEKMYQGRI